jgi:hypothetical protein
MIYPVPAVEFTECARSNMIASARLSPDAFLLATFLTDNRLDLPQASVWKDCPVLEWSALAVAGRSPFGCPLTNNPIVLRDSLEVVRTAQQVHPQNGALWLAEAHLRFLMDEDERAIEALQTSFQKGHWNRQIGPAFLHVRKLLEAQGLPRFHASLDAHLDLATWSVFGGVQSNIKHSMMNAVTSEDDARFRALVSLVIQLQQRLWEDKNVTAYLASVPLPAFRPRKDLLDAMAKRLGRPPISDLKKATSTEMEEAELAIFREYLDTYAGRELADKLLKGNEIVAHQLKQKQEAYFTEDCRRLTWLMIESDICGSFCSRMFTLFLAAFVTNAAFVLITVNPFSMKTLLRTPGFWLLSVVALVASISLVTDFFYAVNRHQRFPGPMGEVYWIKGVGDHLIYASMICLIWFAFKVYWHWKVKSPRWVPLSLASMGFIYLGMVCFTAWIRFEYVQWVASTYLP